MVRRLFEPGARDVLYIVDVSGYVFRAYHALPPLTSPSGEPTHAVYGTVNMLERLFKQCSPVLCAVAMDAGKQTFRRELYPEYKAHRPEAPPDLRQQMQRVEQLLTGLKLAVFVQPGVEADDLIASLVTCARQSGLRVVIVSADKDLMPLVAGDVLLWDTMRDKVWGTEEVEERFGVRVDQVRDYLALIGDSSDNVPGVPSIGPKTAQTLLTEYEDIDGVYRNLAQIKRVKLRETLEQHHAQALLSRELVTLKQDCTVDFDIGRLTRGEPDVANLGALYEELGFQRQRSALLARAAVSPGAGPAAAQASLAFETSPGAIDAVAAASAAALSPELSGELKWGGLITTREELSALLEQARQEGLLVMFPALQSVGQREHLVGLGLSVQTTQAFYLPLGHRYVGAPPQLAAAEVRDLLANGLGAGVKLAGHDVKALAVALAGALGDASFVSRRFDFDTLLASYLIDPEAGNDLTELAERELALALGDVTALTKPRRNASVPLDELSVEELGPLMSRRAGAVRRLWTALEAQLRELSLMELFEKLELPLARLLSELELRGVLVDVTLLGKIGAEIAVKLSELEREAQALVERPFNVHSPRQLEALLFDELGLKPLKRTKTSRSTDAATLEALADQHPLPALVLEIRKLAKLAGTYVEALPVLVRKDTGRLHTRWGQATAATGRIASSDPNLQNIPIRTELGRAIRAAFVAPPGHRLVSADYSQIELRVLAHLSRDPVLSESFHQREDVHTRTAMEIFGVAREQLTAEHRRRAKAVNFGVIYGQGEQGLAKSLGISRSEAGQFIAAYFHRYQGVRAFMESTLDEARRTRSVRTLLGRLRRVPDIRESHQGRRAAAERVAMNTPIQGTAADLLKLAMLELREPVTPGCRMILTVHDELVFEVPEAEVEAAMPLIRSRMESVYALDVPLVVDVGHGASWDQAH